MDTLLHMRQILCLVLVVLSNPSWSFSIDLLLTDQPCPTPVVCRQNVGKSPVTLTLIPYSSSLFVAAKTVKSTHGDIVLHSSQAFLQLTDESGEIFKSNYSLCSMNCATLKENFRHIYLHTVIGAHEDKSQLIFYNTGRVKFFMEKVLKGINLILSLVKWENVIVLSSNREDLSILTNNIRSSKQATLITDDDDYMDSSLNSSLLLLYTLLQEKDLNFILICSSSCVVKVLHQAHVRERYTKKKSKWLVVPSDENLADIIPDNLTVKMMDVVILEFVQLLKPYPSIDLASAVRFLSDMQPKDGAMFDKDLYRYIQKTPTSGEAYVSANIYTLDILLSNTTFNMIGYIGQDDSVVLTEQLFPGMTYEFHNRTLIVTLLEWPPFVIKEKENGTDVYSGICIDLLEELARSLNFSYKFIEPEDQEFGRVFEGNLTGMVELVANKKADLLLGPIAVDASRGSVLDFTKSHSFERSAVIFKKQDPNTHKWMTLAAPFRYEIYICLFFSFIFSTVLLFAIEEVNPENTWADNRLSARLKRYSDILWYHFGALMANGGDYLPSTQAGRSILSCWWLFAVISAAVYSGNLIAFLTDWRGKPPFTTLEEMVEQDTYKWGTLGGSTYTNLFQSSSQPEFKKIWAAIQANKMEDPDVLSVNNDVHLRKILLGNYAYIADVSSLDVWKTEHCDLDVMHTEFFNYHLALGLMKDSIYTDLFSSRILRINDGGLMDKWHRRWNPPSYCQTSISVKRVGLLALQSAFYAAGVGALLAFIIIVTENVYKKSCKNQSVSEENTRGREN